MSDTIEVLNAEVEFALLSCPKGSNVLVFRIGFNMGGIGTAIRAHGDEATRWILRLFDVLEVGDFVKFDGAKCRVRKIKGCHIGAKALAIGHWTKDVWLILEEPKE